MLNIRMYTCGATHCIHRIFLGQRSMNLLNGSFCLDINNWSPRLGDCRCRLECHYINFIDYNRIMRSSLE
uniref:Uncharacterized protein n=1 Tax=Heterorhabditis bacteriophora TaxID=37862 RepID=A0A1I7WDW4_HETBA